MTRMEVGSGHDTKQNGTHLLLVGMQFRFLKARMRKWRASLIAFRDRLGADWSARGRCGLPGAAVKRGSGARSNWASSSKNSRHLTVDHQAALSAIGVAKSG